MSNIAISPEASEILKAIDASQTGANAIKSIGDKVPLLGKGSARNVYDFSELVPNTVLKVASNVKGIAQNEKEAEISSYGMYKDIVAEVLSHSRHDKWIICEKSEKIKKSDFKKKTGFDFDHVTRALSNDIASYEGRRSLFGKPEDYEAIADSEFYHDLLNVATHHDMPSGDLTRIDSYGESSKLHKLVLRDYGLSNDIYNTYYNKMHKNYYTKQPSYLHTYHKRDEDMNEGLVQAFRDAESLID